MPVIFTNQNLEKKKNDKMTEEGVNESVGKALISGQGLKVWFLLKLTER